MRFDVFYTARRLYRKSEMPYSAIRLKEHFALLPRVRLAALPTPLERCPRLSQLIGTGISLKRDDLTGLALGGNKTRHLEFILGRALAARTEGLMLDPCYTGKALAALVAHARVGLLAGDHSVVFAHAGGTPLTFLPGLGDKLTCCAEEPS
jgi:1-aminocyclopropane-1-carboxylate deaminase/D-cysteine desulfhydrase-like pyridoxal-dependent ACC family enzyme